MMTALFCTKSVDILQNELVRLLSILLLTAVHQLVYAQSNFIESYTFNPITGDVGAHIVTLDSITYLHSASVIDGPEFTYVQGGLSKLTQQGEIVWNNEWNFSFGNVGISFANGIVVNNDTVYTTGNYRDLESGVFSPAIVANSTLTGEYRAIRFPYDYRVVIKDLFLNIDNTFTAISEDIVSDSFNFPIIVEEIDQFGLSSSSLEYLTEFSVVNASHSDRTESGVIYTAHIGCFGTDATCYPFQGWLSKIRADGTFAWSRSYGYTAYNQAVLPKVTIVNDTTIAYAWTRDTNNLDIQESPPIIYYLDTLGNKRDSFAFHGNWRTLSNLRTAANGDVLGVGYAWTDIGYTGWMFRLTPTAELVWERYVQDHRQTTSSATDLVSVTEAADGSIVSCGSIFHPQPPRDNGARLRAWVVKLDSNGCLEPGCTSDTIYLEFPSSAHDPPVVPESDIQVWPNPTVDFLNWSVPDLPVFRRMTDYRIIGAAGYTVASGKLLPGSNRIDVRDLPPGVYFLNLMKDGQQRGVKRFVKR